MTKDVSIRYVHAGDLSTKDAHALTWNVGNKCRRYQELALVENTVVGAWTYDIEGYRRRWQIESERTDVAHRYRRRGVARTLWMRGVQRWNPKRIEAAIGSDEGRSFLAAMTAHLALHAPGAFLFVRMEPGERPAFNTSCWYAAKELLEKIGPQMAAQAKQLAVVAKAPLQLKAVP